ncbi:hypothetical protein N8Z34_03580, partial [Oceanospirillaceae bacterium]|nr:hypothetical protein [Oceanospirillaceae bacterium]
VLKCTSIGTDRPKVTNNDRTAITANGIKNFIKIITSKQNLSDNSYTCASICKYSSQKEPSKTVRRLVIECNKLTKS